MNKRILLPVLGLVLTGAAVLGVGQVSAQTNNPSSGLVQAIASKFNLDPTQVQSVFDNFRQQQMGNRLKTILDKEVAAGKITSTQEQSIINEITTLRSQNNTADFKNMTPAQRQQAFQNIQSQLKSWAQSQGIDISLIPMFGGHFGRGGMMGRWHQATPTPTP